MAVDGVSPGGRCDDVKVFPGVPSPLSLDCLVVGNWTIPGGAMEPGESLTQTAIRETKEETGYHIEVTGLFGTYTNPNRRIEHTSNGEVRQEFSV